MPDLATLEDMAVDMSRDRLGGLDPELQPVMRKGPGAGPIIAGVIWYKQHDYKLVKLIEKCAEYGIAGVVFLDGPYAGLSPQECSAGESYDAIRTAAEKTGLPVDSYKGRIWKSEPMKRTASVRAALDMADRIAPGQQCWFMYLDSDEFPASEVQWDIVDRYGYGSIVLHNYDGDELLLEGEGHMSVMARLFPLSDGLVFGPAHYDVRDNNIPATYLGWEKALSNDCDPCVVVGHDFLNKANVVEYQAYNDMVRYKAEGKVMRVVENFRDHGSLLVRMDTTSAEMANWQPGFVTKFGANFMPDGAEFAVCTGVKYVEGGELVDLSFAVITEEEADAFNAKNQAEQASKEAAISSKTAKRIRKRARHWEREHGQLGDDETGLPR